MLAGKDVKLGEHVRSQGYPKEEAGAACQVKGTPLVKQLVY
jgi:hypothetical protein